ncbi:MAG TPA: LamG domain-containing protein [Steroidobacteraceae bacterium]|nr:LamG domain-containing protein [Steroidobacteraceae bacterium]
MTGLRLICAFLVTAALAACSGGGPSTVQNPVTSAPPVADYNGPPAQNADVQAFKLNLWQNIKDSNRCGGCHNAGGQTPQFARNDDINAAYTAANTVVNLSQPDQSRMVQKVGGGHNCWLASASACADTLTVWIRNWAGASATGGKQIELQEPSIKEVGASKTFPESSASFASTVYPVLHDANKGNCVRCHSSTAGNPISPFFASNDVDEAYAAAKAKINLDLPQNSRFVVRLRDEFHNCWAPNGGGTDCAASATVMQNAIQAFANSIPVSNVDPNLVISKALTLYDGTVAAGGNRFDNNVIALYEFKTGTGTVAYDTSGVEPALNLDLTSPDMWVGGWGINIKAGQKAKGSTAASKKLADMIKATGEFTVEAWMAPADVVQEDAYAITYSGGNDARNFTLAQRAYQYQAMVRASNTDANGMPAFLTKDADRDAQASLQHVVLTYDPVKGRHLYVNGVDTGDPDPKGSGGSLADWDDSFALLFGNETTSMRQWKGLLKLVAIHNRALTLEQIQQNFAAGVGERYFLLFSVSHLVPVPKAYVMFEASQLDSYAYLFNKPTFISLDPTADPGTFPLKGMRIGVNGAEAKVGQTYATLDTTVGGANYDKATGQLLSNVGAVIGLEKGPLSDEFFLSFEQIGGNSHPHPDPDGQVSTAPVVDPDPPPARWGMRTFDELNATYARLTGVSPNTTSVAATYANVKQQLPTVESIDAFLASQQTGIAQLAIAYCNAMVNDNTLRTQFYGSVDPNASSADASVRTAIINSVQAKIIGSTSTQPDSTFVASSLTTMFDGLSGASAATAMKAACAAALGSAATTVQ